MARRKSSDGFAVILVFFGAIFAGISSALESAEVYLNELRERVIANGELIIASLVIIVFLLLLPRLIRFIRKKIYFSSEKFVSAKLATSQLIDEHNEVFEHVQFIRESGNFEVGASKTGELSHLARTENTSAHAYKRDKNVANFASRNVHNCSLQVVRNASASPIKYLIKYFNIKENEESLVDIESLGEDISKLENAISNLNKREYDIKQKFSPPNFILKHYHDEFMEQCGVHLSKINVPYPVYIFEYVSAGGNSGQRTTVQLNSETIDHLIEAISGKIKFKKSAAGQRALMTAKFRAFIKDRDNHQCKSCGVSVRDEPHLLLEVDHIIPVSKGGLSTKENLQTLCWKCNRTKSNKIIAA